MGPLKEEMHAPCCMISWLYQGCASTCAVPTFAAYVTRELPTLSPQTQCCNLQALSGVQIVMTVPMHSAMPPMFGDDDAVPESLRPRGSILCDVCISRFSATLQTAKIQTLKRV